jgi:DNA polymerase III delta subunit
MPAVSAAAVRKQIASGSTAPVYLLLGEDEIDKAALATEFANAIDEGLRAFNVERVHAGDMTTADKLADGVATLVAAARTLPMMVPRRVVIVTQAETILAPKRDSEAASRALDELEKLLQRPEPQTTLVLVAGSVDKRSRLYKLLTKEAVIVECGAIESQDDAERWVRARVAAAGQQIEPAAARRLAERAGFPERPQKEKTGNFVRLRGEVDRLLLYAMGQPKITTGDVVELSGAAELRDTWALANAIEAGQTGEALRQLALLFDAGAAGPQILGQLGWLVRTKFPTLAPGMLPAAVQALFRTDLALKSSGGEPRILLERLVVELADRKRPT